MKTVRTLTVALVVLLSGGVGRAQQLSTAVFPSEDELYEALQNNEIDYYQYLILREIAQHGIDSNTQYLLDEIPNLLFIQSDSAGTLTALESEQAASFRGTNTEERFKRWQIRYGHYQSLDDESRRQYRLAVATELNSSWRATFNINREYSGRERWVRRTVQYRNSRGMVRQLVLGSSSARLGLGTVIGYRGKLLGFSDQLNGESFLFPDYGGINGVYLDTRAAGIKTQIVGSVNRDETYALLTTGGMVSRASGRFRPGVIFGMNRLRNRANGETLVDLKTAGNLYIRYGAGVINLEAAEQFADLRRSRAVVAEGKHRLSMAEIDYALWSYGRDYLDLSSGSKATWLTCREVVDPVGYELSTRRKGQTGILIRTVVQLETGWELANSAILARLNRDTSRTELFSSLRRQWSRKLSTQVDYLARNRERTGIGGYREDFTRRVRFEVRFAAGDLSLRSYIGYTTDNQQGDYVSLFGAIRGYLKGFGIVEAWSNISRLSDSIEYWYMFFRYRQQLVDDITLAVKFATEYHSGGSDRFRPLLSVEINSQL